MQTERALSKWAAVC